MFNIASTVYNFLADASPWRRYAVGDKLLSAAWSRAGQHFDGPVKTIIHGEPVTVNFGYTYPVFSRKYPSLNNPLIELAYQTYQIRRNPLIVVDVGAAVGDTVLFLRANCGQFISQYVCVDGDKEFLGYLRANVGRFGDVIIIPALLSEANVSAPALERTHAGTASAQGDATEQATTFDEAVLSEVNRVDVIKIDVDGFDGRVLAGAKKTLTQFQPTVIFEWHPKLYKKTGSDLLQPFTTLQECNYHSFVWFNKYGEFSHFMRSVDTELLQQVGRLCIDERLHVDWHYDVVAIPGTILIDPVQMAECQFARSCRSRF